MISIRDEGQPIKYGFNFYPLHSYHIGFVFRLWKHCIWCRYGKAVNRFTFKISKEQNS